MNLKSLIATVFLLLIGMIGNSQSYQDQEFTNLFRQDGDGWNAGDGTISIPLPNGNTLWMFGDSHVDQEVDSTNQLPCLFNTRNCVMLQDDNDNFTTFYNQSGSDIYSRQFVQMQNSPDITFWPAGGFVLNNTAYTFWESYTINSLSDITFEGMVIAEIDLDNIEVLSVTPLDNTSIEFGMTVVTDNESGFHFIYGRKNSGIFREAFIARCPIGQIYTDWEFYAGDNNWINDPTNAKSILNEVSNSYSVFKCDTKYFLLSQARGFLQCGEGREIYLYESENPHGPFVNKTIAYTIEDQYDGQYLVTYNAQAHPQFTTNNELLISYNINQPCPGPCTDEPFTSVFNADLYRPKFARYSLPTICSSSSTIDIKEQAIFSVYPNPVRQTAFILSENHDTETKQFQLYNTLGVMLKEGSTKSQINMENMNSGVYILKLKLNAYEQVEVIYKI